MERSAFAPPGRRSSAKGCRSIVAAAIQSKKIPRRRNRKLGSVVQSIARFHDDPREKKVSEVMDVIPEWDLEIDERMRRPMAKPKLKRRKMARVMGWRAAERQPLYWVGSFILVIMRP